MDKCPLCGSEVKRHFERRGRHHGVNYTECTSEACVWGMAEADTDEDAIDAAMERHDDGK